MKFLVFAVCVCAANAASFGYKPWQTVQPVQQVSQAFAQSVVSAPEVAYKAVEQPAVRNIVVPVATTAPSVYKAPAAVAKSAVYTAPVAAAKTAAFADREAKAAILRFDSVVAPESFNYIFETQNGIAAQSTGVLKKVDNTEVLAIQGSYQYVAPDGTPVQFTYVADENGYQPRSDLLPVGPPIPEAIVRSLEYLRTHPQKSENY